jgi:hypothetical protein
MNRFSLRALALVCVVSLASLLGACNPSDLSSIAVLISAEI